jgi:hypothetical protein
MRLIESNSYWRRDPMAAAKLNKAKVVKTFGLICGALLAGLAGASPAMAQSGPPPATPSSSVLSEKPQPVPTPVSPLTVEAPPDRALLLKQARGYVESYAAPTHQLGQFARWYPQIEDLRTILSRRDAPLASDIRPLDVIEPACVGVTGVIPEQAAPIQARVEQVARSVGAPLAPPKCTPNIQILITAEPQRDLDAIAARGPAALGYEGEKTVTRPIQAWYLTATLDQRTLRQSGLPSSSPISAPPPPAGPGGFIGRVTSERNMANRGATARPCIDIHLPICAHAAFLNVLVIVDAGHMGDVSVELTSDYVAMLALSQPRSLNGCMALPSVIDLYAKDCAGRDPPTGLTSADMAYLSSLYAADLTVAKSSEQSDIANRMVKILAAAKAPAR